MLKLEYKDYTLEFKFEAGTSRGKMNSHQVVYLRLWDDNNVSLRGYGEIAPLPGLSVDAMDDILDRLPDLCRLIGQVGMPLDEEGVFRQVKMLVGEDYPSIRMALETAFLDLLNGGRRLIYENEFSRGDQDIEINGLVWMGDPDFMKKQVEEKVASGFKCIKLKVGALNFEEEVALVQYLRTLAPEVSIRLDANGGFPLNEVFGRLSSLEPFGVHSIEQPIVPHQEEAMGLICSRSSIPIALDEELIGLPELSQKQELLKLIHPQFVILKPTLLGGFSQTQEWIRLADQMNIGWWVTSALESNVGLNAISQFAWQYGAGVVHGLGTGQLYTNNIESPLEINGSYLGYNIKKNWIIDF